MTANDGRTLGAIGIKARELFSVLTGASKKLPLTSRFFDPRELVNHFEKFELWALNLGLNAPGHSSLDYRLRDWEVANDIVRRLLEDVRDALTDIEFLVSETSHDDNVQYGEISFEAEAGVSRSLDETNPSITSELADELRALGYESEDEAVDTLTEDLVMNRQKVSDALDRLYKIATKLRNPTTRLISERIALFKHIDADTGVDLMIRYSEYDQRHISELLNQRIVNTDDERELSQVAIESRKAEKPHFLVSRLAQGNTIRRKQFYQWRRHRLKLEYAVYSSSELPEERSIQVVGKSAALVLGAPSNMGYSSPTTATNLNVQAINWDEDRSIVSVSEYAANADASEKDLAFFPDPPPKKEGTKYFECPYCFTICPNAYLKTQDAWRNHLIRDLRPYMCTYKDCISGQELWATRTDWMQHEDSCHRKVWRCLEHRNLTFETRKTYDDHLKHSHTGASEQLRTFELFRAGESSETEARRPCPFCGKGFRTVLESEHHIAMHMERIAAFTLPRSAGQEDESAVESNWSVRAKNRVDNQHSELVSSIGNDSFASIPRYHEADSTHTGKSAGSSGIGQQRTGELPPLPPQAEEEEEPPASPAGDISSISDRFSGVGGERAKAEYDYDAAEDNEVSFREGEIVTDIEKIDPDWWVVTNEKGETGLVPANYLSSLDEDDRADPIAAAAAVAGVPEATPAEPEHEAVGAKATAQYDYEASEDNELSFPENATITNVTFPDEDWWHGEYQGRSGLFPSNYVELQQ